MARKRRTFTLEFKQEAVRLVHSEDMTYAQVGRDLGVNKSVIRDWCVKSVAGELEGKRSSSASPRSPSSVEDELARLRKENRILREEREILKKAAAFFAKETR